MFLQNKKRKEKKEKEKKKAIVFRNMKNCLYWNCVASGDKFHILRVNLTRHHVGLVHQEPWQEEGHSLSPKF